MTMLTENFSLAEMTRTSQRFANVPTPAEIAALTTLCVKVLEPIRAHYRRPVTVNSGFRGKKVNDAVGSSDGSQHRRGEAADIEVDGIPNITLAEYIRDTLAFDQLILEAYRPGVAGSGWVHVSYRQGRLRKQVLTMTMSTHGPVYSKGLTP
jgi:zinc D-Ala-D-Ala carboxypeptidase